MIRLDQLNASIRDIPLPQNMRRLPVSKQGFPVPFFVARHPDTLEWDFRVVYPDTFVRCIKERLCWICGQPLGRKFVFVAGPMCIVTKTSAEPPSHHTCAEYSALACPFLAQPRMRRNEVDLPEGHTVPAGIGIMRNPGVTALLITEDFKIFNDGHGRPLVRMGRPSSVEWYAQRRRATAREVLDSIESGMSLLMKECDAEDTPQNRREAHAMLAQQLQDTLRLIAPDDSIANLDERSRSMIGGANQK